MVEVKIWAIYHRHHSVTVEGPDRPLSRLGEILISRRKDP